MIVNRIANRFNLRSRLLLSYLVLLMVALGVIALALLVFIGNRPGPAEPTYERLAALTQGLNLLDTIADFPRDAQLGFIQEQIPELLDVFAETRDVRTMQIRLRPSGPIVLHDSAGTFAPRQPIRLLVDGYANERLERALGDGGEQFFGGFSDPGGSEWLFGGIIFRHSRHFVERIKGDNLWILAEPRPTVSLQHTLAAFSNSLVPPLLQAGIVGIAFAFLLAALISRTIAKPLQRVARGATDIARGDYTVQVPESGPPELRALAESFNRMTAEVMASNNAQRDFLGNVSHDLKTPLTSIQGYAQAIIDGAAEDPEEAAQIIYEEASRLNRMVVELTDLARLEAGRLSLRHAEIELAPLVEGVTQSLQLLAENKGIALETRTASLPPVVGDGDRLAQVFMNLLSNALKFTESGGTVSVDLREQGDGALVAVRDSGIGISKAEQGRIFERFYQVDKARGPQRGTGLGLAIAQEIVEAHGGSITVSSRGRGQGAVFRVWLPGAGGG